MRVLALVICCFCCQSILAQDKARAWYVPDVYKVQLAGNIGFVSVGAGFIHARDKMETDLYIGYLPERIGGDDIFTLTAKTTFMPWKWPLNDKYDLVPFATGFYLSYSFGSQFDTILPNEYPDGYYWWASSLRFGGFIGGNITMTLPANSKIKSVALYYELGTYDLIFLSYMQNIDYLDITDVVSLSLGIKVAL